jgi:mannose/fructose/N-acetylgalactosamine-specific phosphotransferase system component IIC
VRSARAGQGLMVAGGILTAIGLCIVLIKTLMLPGYWTPLLVGLALLLVGAIVRATSSKE